MNSFDEAVNFLSADRYFNPSLVDRHTRLMKEFIRREAMVSRRLGISSDTPFIDLSAIVSMGMSIDDSLTQNIIASFSSSTAEHKCCLFMLSWFKAIEHQDAATRINNELTPYAPLLLFFREGGSFTKEHGVFIDIDDTSGFDANEVLCSDLMSPFSEEL